VFDIRHKLQIDSAILKDIFHFSKWVLISSLLTFLATQADRIFLSGHFSESDFGLYSITVMLASFGTVLISKLSQNLWLPVISNSIARNVNLQKVYYRIRLLQDSVIGIGIIIAGIFAPDIIGVIYDQRYQAIGDMIQYYLPSVLVMSASFVNSNTLVALKETKVEVYVVALRVVVMVIGLPLFFNKFGVDGVFLTVFLAFSVSLFPQYIKLQKYGVLNVVNEIILLPVILLIYLYFVLI
jgi:O-antigen/teichoic acid export membrane protein